MYFALYNPTKQTCHEVGCNSENLEELRSELLDYILTGKFDELERATLSKLTLKGLTEIIDYSVIQMPTRIGRNELTHFRKEKSQLKNTNISQMQIFFGKKYIFDYAGNTI